MTHPYDRRVAVHKVALRVLARPCMLTDKQDHIATSAGSTVLTGCTILMIKTATQ